MLHVGCGAGGLAAGYRPRNPAARLLGIENDPTLLDQASRSFDAVAAVDIESNPVPFELPEGLDCLVYDGILEQLGDPWRIVAAQSEALTSDGVIVMSLPNPGFWQTLERALHGQPDGTWLTPAAAFTPEMVMRHLERIGLIPCDVMESQVSRPLASPFLDAMAPALQSLGIEPEGFAKRASAARLVWRVRKQPRQRLFLSGSMLDPVGGVSHVRVVFPMQALATDPSVITEIKDSIDSVPLHDDTPRIFILHRPALVGEHGRNLVQTLSTNGHLVITEFDDHPDFFPMMQRGGALSFAGVHALQTSTTALAGVLRKYNPEVAVFPNAIPSLPEIRNFADSRTITVFFGALNREGDWETLMPVINEVIALAGDRLRFQVVHDKGFFDALQSPHKAFTPTCDYDAYLRLLGGCEVCFMPLSDTAFNRAKSDLKFIEAGACRVMSLASPVVYAASVEHGRTGLLFNNPDELRTNLLRILALPENARSIADNARDHVAKHRMLAYQVAPRIAWYRSLWERREELFAAQRERVRAFYEKAA
ncbi:MAG TPA: glycosyltransferase [Rhodopila sp.]|nr:glycosyltransferase [Rhodopila sp.]